jgi:hypothetical protein
MEQEFFQLIHHSPASEAAPHPLSEAVRLGAQLMLQRALEQEVTGFLGRGHYQRSPDGPVRGCRSGYESKRVQSAEGTLVLEVPQVRDTLEEFESLWLRALLRRSEKLTALAPAALRQGSVHPRHRGGAGRGAGGGRRQPQFGQRRVRAA